jgi:hypothetical protein
LERRCDNVRARYHRRVLKLPGDSRRNVLLATTPGRVDNCIPQRRHQ